MSYGDVCVDINLVWCCPGSYRGRWGRHSLRCRPPPPPLHHGHHRCCSYPPQTQENPVTHRMVGLLYTGKQMWSCRCTKVLLNLICEGGFRLLPHPDFSPCPLPPVQICQSRTCFCVDFFAFVSFSPVSALWPSPPQTVPRRTALAGWSPASSPLPSRDMVIDKWSQHNNAFIVWWINSKWYHTHVP